MKSKNRQQPEPKVPPGRPRAYTGDVMVNYTARIPAALRLALENRATALGVPSSLVLRDALVSELPRAEHGLVRALSRDGLRATSARARPARAPAATTLEATAPR
jgi:hypothetical protein